MFIDLINHYKTVEDLHINYDLKELLEDLYEQAKQALEYEIECKANHIYITIAELMYLEDMADLLEVDL